MVSKHKQRLCLKDLVFQCETQFLFFKQVIMQNRLPFDVKVPFNKLFSISDLKEDEFNLELEKAENDF